MYPLSPHPCLVEPPFHCQFRSHSPSKLTHTLSPPGSLLWIGQLTLSVTFPKLLRHFQFRSECELLEGKGSILWFSTLHPHPHPPPNFCQYRCRAGYLGGVQEMLVDWFTLHPSLLTSIVGMEGASQGKNVEASEPLALLGKPYWWGTEHSGLHCVKRSVRTNATLILSCFSFELCNLKCVYFREEIHYQSCLINQMLRTQQSTCSVYSGKVRLNGCHLHSHLWLWDFTGVLPWDYFPFGISDKIRSLCTWGVLYAFLQVQC